MVRTTTSLRGHTFLGGLTAASVVIDGGGNHGDFSRAVAKKYGCRVFTVEPNPALVAAMATEPGMTVLPYALGDRDGTITLALSDNDAASSIVTTPAVHTGSVDVPLRSLPTLMQEIGVTHVDLLKLDIEGAEVPLLKNTPEDVLKRVRQMTVEFHDFAGYVSPGDVTAAIERLKRIGFVSCPMSHDGLYDVLLINKNAVRFSGLRGAWAILIDRKLIGFLRRVKYAMFGTPPPKENHA